MIKWRKDQGSASVNIAFVLLLIQLWLMEAIIFVLLLSVFWWVLSWMVIFDLSSSVVVEVDVMLGTSLRVGLHFFLVVFLEVVVFWGLVVLGFLHVAISLVLWWASLLILSLLGLVNSTILDQQRPLEYLCVDLYHFVLIVCLFLLLFPLELFDLVSDDSSRPVDINVTGLQSLPHKWSKLLFSKLPYCLRALFFLNLLLFFLQLPSSELHQSLELLRLGNVREVLLILDFLVFWVSELPTALLSLILLISGPWFLWPIFKRERLELDRLLVILCIFKIEVKMLMNGLEIWYSMWNLWCESTVSSSTCRISTLCCSFLGKLILSLDHSLNTFRQVEIRISVDDLFKDLLSSF